MLVIQSCGINFARVPGSRLSPPNCCFLGSVESKAPAVSEELRPPSVLRVSGMSHSMTPLERALDLSYPAFAILHQHGRFSGPQHQRVCEAILGDLRIARRQGVRGVVLEIFSRDQQVMGLLLPDAGPPELLGFDDRTMMYEGDAKDWEAQVHWHGDQLRR